MFFKLHWTAFILAFSAGILYVYLFTPLPVVVLKFPTPYNAGKVVYTDRATPGTCFKYAVEKLDACPKDRTHIREQPM